MTMPALVIGLGGTGRWVLTYLKKDLLEANNGELPTHVRLLAYDTDRQPIMDSVPDTSAVHGSVTLRPDDEYHHLGGNLHKFILAVKQGQYPAVAKWFDPDGSLFSTLPGAALNMSHGAGQIRQLGRLSLLQDLTRGEDSILRCSLARALTALRREVHDRASLRIFIAASLVGGTGSAMFIDVALLVREMCSSYSIPSMIVGYLALFWRLQTNASEPGAA